MPIAYLF